MWPYSPDTGAIRPLRSQIGSSVAPTPIPCRLRPAPLPSNEMVQTRTGTARLLLTRVLGGRCERGPVDCFIFDGREFAEPSLPSPAVVGPVDPGRDGQWEVLSGEPPLTVQDVLLQQREEGLHCGVVRARADPAHRSGEPLVPERFDEAARPEPGASIRGSARWLILWKS